MGSMGGTLFQLRLFVNMKFSISMRKLRVLEQPDGCYPEVNLQTAPPSENEFLAAIDDNYLTKILGFNYQLLSFTDIIYFIFKIIYSTDIY